MLHTIKERLAAYLLRLAYKLNPELIEEEDYDGGSFGALPFDHPIIKSVIDEFASDVDKSIMENYEKVCTRQDVQGTGY